LSFFRELPVHDSIKPTISIRWFEA
jgi:hypothetical protein